MQVSPRIALRLLLLACLTGGAVAAAREVEKELEGIKKKIEQERRGISRVKKHEGSVLSALTSMEGELERKNKELKQISTRLESYTGNLQKTEAEIKKISSSLRERKELLKKRVRAFYKWQRSGSPFILLNGDLNGDVSVGELMRRKEYLETTLAQDQRLIMHYAGESERQERLKKEVARKKEGLNTEREALLRVQESIRIEREKKREFLASLRREKESHGRALKELEQAAHRLQKMMDEMSRKAVARSPSGSGFELKRGTLELPVRGAIVEGFGRTKHPEFSAEMFRKGVEIEAPLGEQVRAVETGTVIFADRFSGYGKMLIIDHGERYYTVYAHLAEIHKSVGETVQKGEAIASVGDSESLKGPRLYFEIRKDGKPLDPMVWLRKR